MKLWTSDVIYHEDLIISRCTLIIMKNMVDHCLCCLVSVSFLTTNVRIENPHPSSTTTLFFFGDIVTENTTPITKNRYSPVLKTNPVNTQPFN